MTVSAMILCLREYAGHARILVEEARTTGKYSHIVAVGGDGTVNEVGGALCGSDIAFAVVSLGSGNGFAGIWDILFL